MLHHRRTELDSNKNLLLPRITLLGMNLDRTKSIEKLKSSLTTNATATNSSLDPSSTTRKLWKLSTYWNKMSLGTSSTETRSNWTKCPRKKFSPWERNSGCTAPSLAKMKSTHSYNWQTTRKLQTKPPEEEVEPSLKEFFPFSRIWKPPLQPHSETWKPMKSLPRGN